MTPRDIDIGVIPLKNLADQSRVMQDARTDLEMAKSDQKKLEIEITELETSLEESQKDLDARVEAHKRIETIFDSAVRRVWSELQ